MGTITIFPGWWYEVRHERAKVGPLVSGLVAATLNEGEKWRMKLALSSLSYAVQIFACEPVNEGGYPGAVPETAIDHMLPGHIIVAYADAHPGGGYAAITNYEASIFDLAQSYRDLPADLRRIMLRDTALDIRASHRRRTSGEASHSRLSRLAALALRDDQAQQLGGLDDGVPILAMVGDTRDRGGAPKFFLRTLLTTIPRPLPARPPSTACA